MHTGKQTFEIHGDRNPPRGRLAISLINLGSSERKDVRLHVAGGMTIDVMVLSMKAEPGSRTIGFEGMATSTMIPALKTPQRIIGSYDDLTHTGRISII